MRRFRTVFGAYCAAVLVAAIPIAVPIAYNGTVYLSFWESILGILSATAGAVALFTIVPSIVAIYITEAIRVRNPLGYAIFGAGLAASNLYLGTGVWVAKEALLLAAAGSAAGLTYWWIAWRLCSPANRSQTIELQDPTA